MIRYRNRVRMVGGLLFIDVPVLDRTYNDLPESVELGFDGVLRHRRRSDQRQPNKDKRYDSTHTDHTLS